MFGQPSVNSIVSALREIEAASGGAATRPPRSNLIKVIEMLEKSGASSVQEVVQRLKTAQSQTKKKATPKSADQGVVASYLERLQSARNTPQDFARALEDLLKDRKVRLAQELREITNSYTGGGGTYKSKLDARQAIERKYHGRWIADQYALKAS